MAEQIWKFPLEAMGHQRVQIPLGAEILCVQMQAGKPCLWALVDFAAGKVERSIEIFGTGHPIPSGDRRYIGTFQVQDGAFVFHAFELIAEGL
jgi:hypothetical protein